MKSSSISLNVGNDGFPSERDFVLELIGLAAEMEVSEWRTSYQDALSFVRECQLVERIGDNPFEYGMAEIHLALSPGKMYWDYTVTVVDPHTSNDESGLVCVAGQDFTLSKAGWIFLLGMCKRDTRALSYSDTIWDYLNRFVLSGADSR